jgi:predicted SprT family Zn-dependent metalloprotease
LVTDVTRFFLFRFTASSKRDPDDALDAAPREYRRLDRDLLGLLVVHESAHLRVLALGVLAHHHHVDLSALAQRQRRLQRRDRDTPAACWRTDRTRGGWAAASR